MRISDGSSDVCSSDLSTSTATCSRRPEPRPMRADTISAKTWLLGAAAAWALCAWLLALLGMGGGVTMLAEDPALLQPLPQAGTLGRSSCRERVLQYE